MKVKQIKFSGRNITVPDENPRLKELGERRRVCEAVVLLPNWASASHKISNKDAIENGVYWGESGQPVLDGAGKEIPLSVPEHMHRGVLLQETGVSSGQVLNLHAYLEDKDILGGRDDCVAVYMVIEEVPKLWKIFHHPYRDYESFQRGSDGSKAIKVLARILDGVEGGIKDFPKELPEKDVRQISDALAPLWKRGDEILKAEDESAAEVFIQELGETLEGISFRQKIYPISLYPLSREEFLEFFRRSVRSRHANKLAGVLGVCVLELQPGVVERQTRDAFHHVTRHPFKKQVSTIAVRELETEEMRQVFEVLQYQDDLSSGDIIGLSNLLDQRETAASEQSVSAAQ